MNAWWKKIYENLRQSIQIFENLCNLNKSIKIDENLRISTIVYENLWKSFNNPRKSIEVYENLWKSYKIFEHLWKSINIYENEWKQESLRNSINTCGNLRNCLKMYENLRMTRSRTFNLSIPLAPKCVHDATKFSNSPNAPNLQIISVGWAAYLHHARTPSH